MPLETDSGTVGMDHAGMRLSSSAGMRLETDSGTVGMGHIAPTGISDVPHFLETDSGTVGMGHAVENASNTERQPGACSHESFECQVSVARIEDIGRFMAEVRVKCVQCGTPFRFLGLPLGMDYNSACVSPDGLEARMGIAPGREPIPPVDGVTGFSIKPLRE